MTPIRDQSSPSSPSSLRPKPSIFNPTSLSSQHVHKHPGSTAFCSDYSIPKLAFAWVWTQGKLTGPQGISALYAVSLCLLWLWTNPWTKASTSTNNDYKALEFTIPCSSGLGKGWISNVFGRYITWRDNAMEAVRFAVSISLEYSSMPQLSRIRLRNVPRINNLFLLIVAIANFAEAWVTVTCHFYYTLQPRNPAAQLHDLLRF